MDPLARQYPHISALRLSRMLRNNPPAPAQPAPAPAQPELPADVAAYRDLSPEERACYKNTLDPVDMTNCGETALIPCGHIFAFAMLNAQYLHPGDPPAWALVPGLAENETSRPVARWANPAAALCPTCRSPVTGFMRLFFS